MDPDPIDLTISLRVHETVGVHSKAKLPLTVFQTVISVPFKLFEIKTIRVESSGKYREVDLLEQRP